MQFMIDAIKAAPPAKIATFALAGAVIGTIAMPLIIYVGLKLNLKRIRTVMDNAGIPRNAAFYRLMSATGAALFAIVAASQPVLDAAGDNEVYIRGALIPILLIVVGWPTARAFKHLRENSHRRS